MEGISGGWLSELGRRIERFGTGGGRREEVFIDMYLGSEPRRIIYCAGPILHGIMDGRIPILVSVFVSLGIV